MKKAVTLVLLLFVGGSIAYLLGDEIKSESAAVTPDESATGTGEPKATSPGVTLETEGETATGPPKPDVVAYYFHGASRCTTCLTMEKYAREAIEEVAPRVARDGQVRWTTVNFDEPVNEHFVKDYQLVASSLVIARADAGGSPAWQRLDRIWDLVGDEQAFKQFVKDEVTKLLRERT